MKTGKMKESLCLVKIEKRGKGKATGVELCVVRYFQGYAGDHTPSIVWGPQVTVFAEDVICE